MTSQGMGGFCRIEGNMDADLYCDIMRGELMDTNPTMILILPTSFFSTTTIPNTRR